MLDLFDTYLGRVEQALLAGNATEHTHRAALVDLLDGLAAEIGRDLRTTNEPKRRTDCGAPDLVTKRGDLTVAWGECKDVGVSLDKTEAGEQMDRYRAALPNLVLTDYLAFRLYVDGEKAPRATARLATPDARGRLTPVEGGREAVRALLTDLLTREPEPIGDPDRLAAALATRTHLLRDVVKAAFERGAASHTLTGLRRAFAETLLPHLDEPDHLDEFVDMYAQTLAYGLFAARVHHDGAPASFTRRAAAGAIPRTNPLLRRLFETLTGLDLDDEPHAGLVDDLVALLAHADMTAVLRDFGKRTRQEDPVVHFYETFLREYDPRLRELRGVYYTPAPVVSYIVRSVDAILRRDFGVARGLADDKTIAFKTPAGEPDEKPQVLVLDPACGTGTFLYHVVDHVRQSFIDRGQETWSQYVGEKLLPRLFGFELLMAPYAVAHLKLGLALAGEDLPAPEDVPDDAAVPKNVRQIYRYDFEKDERLQVYLTNTLEEADRTVQSLFGPYKAISDEAAAAARVKEDRPIMVILGNPPYSGHSANDGAWARGLIEDYKRGFPDLYRPGQAKWLHDDYVKFLRWAEWRVNRTGYGIVAFITNNGFLDNPTFKGMRKHLQDSFDAIYLLDLHGSTKKKETAPDGSPDENVFDIQQGVSIGLFVKQPRPSDEPARVYHADLYGRREAKYHELRDTDVTSTDWQELSPDAPFHLFIPLDEELKPEYEAGWSVADIFGDGRRPAPGMVTTHDQFAISFSPDEAAEKVEALLGTKTEQDARKLFRLCTTDQWSYAQAKRELASGEWRESIAPVLYRPFDSRWTVYDSNVAVHRRERVSSHLLAGPNFGLSTTRKIDLATGWEHVFVSDQLIQHHTVSSKEVNYLFPLYLYPEENPADLFAAAQTGREPNLTPAFVAALQSATGLAFVPDGTGDLIQTVGPEDVLAYAYAVFHSPAFRARYAAFLKIDFPRLPLTTDRGLFQTLVALGHRLVALHLLRDVPAGALPAFRTGGEVVTVGDTAPRYVAPEASESGRGEVWLNDRQRVEGVPPEAWAFQVGGYQPAEKWLKDRRGRTLSFDETEHYAATLAALAATGALMADVDDAIEAAGGFPFS